MTLGIFLCNLIFMAMLVDLVVLAYMAQPTVGFVCDEDDGLGLNVWSRIHLNFDQISSQIDLRNFDVILLSEIVFF